MPTNDFYPFCPTDTGTNLEEQSAYIADIQRTDGNQPGVASAQLVNKALRQGTYVSGQLAQFLANVTNTDVLDNATPAQLLAQLNWAFLNIEPSVTQYSSGSGTFHINYYFFVASANATAGATYTNNGFTFTVQSTISSAITLNMTGTGAPVLTGGVLTLATGTGDATITYYTVRPPTYIHVQMAGAGGGGGGSGTASGGTGGNGGNTTFGTSFLTAYGGNGGEYAGSGGTGGSTLVSSGAYGFTTYGQAGSGNSQVLNCVGPTGGASFFGGAGVGNGSGSAGTAAQTNSGSGGSGGGTGGTASSSTGSGGGGGGYVDVLIPSPLSLYGYSVGSGGSGGTSGTNGFAGGAGAAGRIIIYQYFQ